ncbi:MAG: enoyl-CoA hydratase-related protein, partial [Burkholderiales bacterium]
MAVRIEKKGKVWTVIHSRPEARNAMDPQSADALVSAFESFDKDPEAAVAVLWGEGGAFCAGWDLKYCASLINNSSSLHAIDYPLDDRKP